MPSKHKTAHLIVITHTLINLNLKQNAMTDYIKKKKGWIYENKVMR